MARWNDLHRALEAGDLEGAEPIWLELIESDLDSIAPYLDAADRMSRRQGGKRQASMLLWILAESLKEKERHRDLIGVYAAIAAMAPDDGTLRTALQEAARNAFPEREDLDTLLEKSGVDGGEASDLAVQARKLDRYLRIEPGAYVFHRSGWGVGRIVECIPDRHCCIIDFRGKPGHEMDLDGAVERLERLEDDDIRAMAMADPRGLRKFAADNPLDVIRQVLERFDGAANLRHIKDSLVPDAVATSRWSTFWKDAKKKALLDPRFHVGSGRDPRIEFFDSAEVDFKTQVDRTLAGCASAQERQKAARELLLTAGEDVEAKEVLQERLQSDLDRTADPSVRLGWNLILAQLQGAGTDAVLRAFIAETEAPQEVVAEIAEDSIRDGAARALIETHPDGAQLLLDVALDADDPVLAEVGVDRFESAGHPEYLPLLLDRVDKSPAGTPVLYAWYVRGLRRGRWSGRDFRPYDVMVRALKVLDAVEYRARRTGAAAARKGVAALADVFARNEGAFVREAAEATDAAGARHLIRILEKNRGLKARQLQKTQDIIFRAQPEALKEPVVVEDGDYEMGERLDQIYMTPEGLERLKAQVEKIEHDEMPANAKEIARAREFGDLSENAEYHAAREKQALLEARVANMKGELGRAVPLTPDVVRTDAVSVGARVRLRDSGGQDVSYTLLGPPDADVAKGVINYLTPLGQALMGRKAGEHVRIEIEGEVRDLEVLAIENGLESSAERV
ncbi:MAG: transcription elongation factor GreA [Planctomycetota bacterium]